MKKQIKISLLGIGVLILFSTSFKLSLAANHPPKSYPIANCTAINVADRRFYSVTLDNWWGSPRPPNNFDSYTTRLWQGNVQELVYAGSKVWVRTGVGESVSSLSGKAWASYNLSYAWAGHTNHPPFAGPIDSAAYVVHNGRFMEAIISGNKVWYRQAQTAGEYDFSSNWSSATLTAAWGGTANHPALTGVDEQTYRVINGKAEELVVQGGNLYRRVGTNSDTNSLPASWTKYTISSIWKNTPNIPTGSPPTLDYQIVSGNYREVVIYNGRYYFRDCTGYPDSIYNSSMRMIDTFLRYYSDNTNYSTLINASYADGHTANMAFRSLMANAIAHTARYQRSANQTDKSKALYYTRATLNNFSKWKESWLSGIPTRDFLLSSWYWWGSLTSSEKNQVENVAIVQSNYLINIFRKAVDAYQRGDLNSSDYKAVSGYIDDTKAEENGASAEALSFASQLFANNPESIKWEYYARCYAYHTITPPSDSEKCFIDTQTVYSDYTLDNHNYHPSPVYTLAGIASLQQAEFAYHLNGSSRPSEFRHNIAKLWQNFHNYYYSYPASPPENSFAIKPEYNPGGDWGDIHITLAMSEFSYTNLFGGGNSGTNFKNLETYSVNYFDDWWYQGFTRYDESSPVASMPKYGTSGVNSRWFGNGLSHGKGAGEIILYHQLKEGKLNLKKTSRSSESIKNAIKNFTQSTTSSHYDANADEVVNSMDFEAFMSVY